MKISNHYLDELNNIKFVIQKSPNISGNFSNSELDTIIIHYTAGRTAQGSVNTLCNPQRKASAHLVIGQDNQIFQLVDFQTIAWHAGISSYNGKHGFNKY